MQNIAIDLRGGGGGCNAVKGSCAQTMFLLDVEYMYSV